MTHDAKASSYTELYSKFIPVFVKEKYSIFAIPNNPPKKYLPNHHIRVFLPIFGSIALFRRLTQATRTHQSSVVPAPVEAQKIPTTLEE